MESVYFASFAYFALLLFRGLDGTIAYRARPSSEFLTHIEK